MKKKKKKKKKNRTNRTNKNYFQKFWNGELSLPQSYWVVGTLIGTAVSLLIMFIVISIGANEALLFVLLIPWYVFVWGGVWRSADKYKGPKGWAILAKISLVLSGVRLLAGLMAGN